MMDEEHNQNEERQKAERFIKGLIATIITGESQGCICGDCEEEVPDEQSTDPEQQNPNDAEVKEKALKLIESGNPFIVISTQNNHYKADAVVFDMREQDVVAALEIVKVKFIKDHF